MLLPILSVSLYKFKLAFRLAAVMPSILFASLQQLQEIGLLWILRIMLHPILAKLCVHTQLGFSFAVYMPAIFLLITIIAET